MKKLKILAIITLIAMVMSSCGTVLGGKIQTCQKTKPAKNEPKRKIRTWALVGDIVLCETLFPLIIDFATGGIYEPCEKTNDKKDDKK